MDTVTAVVPSQDTAKPGGTVSLAGGDSLEYNVLVFATGCSFPAHLAFPEDEVALKEHIANWRDKVKNANNIVIAGGGPVGIGPSVPSSLAHPVHSHPAEFAGEIKDVYPVRVHVFIAYIRTNTGDTGQEHHHCTAQSSPPQ